MKLGMNNLPRVVVRSRTPDGDRTRAISSSSLTRYRSAVHHATLEGKCPFTADFSGAGRGLARRSACWRAEGPREAAAAAKSATLGGVALMDWVATTEDRAAHSRADPDSGGAGPGPDRSMAGSSGVTKRGRTAAAAPGEGARNSLIENIYH